MQLIQLLVLNNYFTPKLSQGIVPTMASILDPPALGAENIPKNFLTGPAPKPSLSRIDFAKTDLTEYEGLYAATIDGILTPEECRALVSLAEASVGDKWERALVNVGGGMQQMMEDTRKCDRIIFDNQEIVNRIWGRVKNLVPELHQLANMPEITGFGPAKRKEVWKMTRLNERMRFLKYTAGEYFKRTFSFSVINNY
jgi:hypothetical protein